jgi:hypothetical protein
MAHIQFYALDEDIISIIEAVERDGPLKYVRVGNDVSDRFPEFYRGLDIPNLGKADRDTGSIWEAYIVGAAEFPIEVRGIQAAGGAQRYCVDQVCNPDTVVFRPAGLWGDDIVLNGQVGTASQSLASQALMRRFSAAFSRHFTKVRAYRVGPQAFDLYKAGKRLTISAQSSRDFDLAVLPGL